VVVLVLVNHHTSGSFEELERREDESI